MGASGVFKTRGAALRCDWGSAFDEGRVVEFGWTDGDNDPGCRRQGVAWLLVQQSDASTYHPGELFICCSVFEGGYVRAMSEEEGPYYVGAPVAWYARVGEPRHEFAAAWRERNRDHVGARNEAARIGGWAGVAVPRRAPRASEGGFYAPASGVSCDD